MIAPASLALVALLGGTVQAEAPAAAPAPAEQSQEEKAPEEKAPPPDCTDVYDRNDEGCVGLTMEPLDAPGDPVVNKVQGDDVGSLLPFDHTWLGWGLLGLGVASVASAVALHVVGYVYSLQLQQAAQAGQLGVEDLNTTTRIQVGINVAAGGMWIVAALLGGSALALWSFDPETGAVTVPFFGE